MEIGIDLVSIKQFLEIKKISPNLGRLILTNEELKLNIEQQAGNFAAKEALLKALNTLNFGDLLEIEVLRARTGKPYFKFYGKTEKMLRRFKAVLSISNKNDMVVALVCLKKINYLGYLMILVFKKY